MRGLSSVRCKGPAHGMLSSSEGWATWPVDDLGQAWSVEIQKFPTLCRTARQCRQGGWHVVWMLLHRVEAHVQPIDHCRRPTAHDMTDQQSSRSTAQHCAQQKLLVDPYLLICEQKFQV